jgi:lysine-ketoglutarate reductase/saccharopine dehydrogenase-like protein (TIGR00300 family)
LHSNPNFSILLKSDDFFNPEEPIMSFTLPGYRPPDFDLPALRQAPTARFAPVTRDGVAPAGYHATSVYPEYLHLTPGHWSLLQESRMDCAVVQRPAGVLEVVEFRRLAAGDSVALGRTENGEEGIYVHPQAFDFPEGSGEKFAFRSSRTRETSFSIDYDQLYDLLAFEKEHGFIVWVLGPAVVFDRDAREAFAAMIAGGYVHALLAGNALATHDLEGALFGTALGQEIYTKRPAPMGHYRHLDALNAIREAGSIARAIADGRVRDGIMRELVVREVPFVLAGSIRDDGPLPEIVADAYQAQDRMRALTRRATTIIGLATQLHTIATGNMAPSYHVGSGGAVRPVYFYSVDMSEFAVGKLADRGSLTARSILTNVQDFTVTVERGLRKRCR